VFFANAVDHDCRNEARPYLSAAGEIRRVDEETPLRTRQPLRSVIRLNNKTDSTPDCEFTPHPGATKLRYATRIFRAEPASNINLIRPELRWELSLGEYHQGVETPANPGHNRAKATN
jgi:hypothetical protein